MWGLKKQFVIFSNLLRAYILCVAKKILIVICNDVKDGIPLLCIFACCSLVRIRGIWHNQCNRNNNYSILLSLYHLDQCRFGFFSSDKFNHFFFVFFFTVTVKRYYLLISIHHMDNVTNATYCKHIWNYLVNLVLNYLTHFQFKRFFYQFSKFYPYLEQFNRWKWFEKNLMQTVVETYVTFELVHIMVFWYPINATLFCNNRYKFR